ncbi:MAG: helicase HerA-like domain-containing protein [Peptoniphilus grossensis]|uniref:helicase HerA-like domain-containing protein n=1 Tax=Peptoniphilus grossensis TaxID=1465756 RepID=UPI00258CD3D0|nr:helicase HerA-like domain-containing protein [Peptoniphilus grossensis]MDU5100128.1 helicase HerA-like domain-containing protein [Peptoniphilus grossensis]
MDKILIGKGKYENCILLNKVNRHGLISGATGTGKTVTLKVLTEGLSDAGVPTILADVKGDLANIFMSGEMNDKLQDRLNELGISNFEFKNYPVSMWDIYGEKGIPLRVTVSEMGPLMLSNILDLNDTQMGVLNIIFRVADSEGLLLIDLKDLKQVINFVNDNRDEISKNYGNVASQSLSAISRKLLFIEDAGGDLFFGEPAIDINDLVRTDASGKGLVNILNANKLISNPLLYSMLLLYLLSEIYENFPEVGDLDKPKLVFFFDEAHLLFNNTPSVLKDKIIQVVRLVRSKGVGVFFITQNPLDVPEEVSSQLSNRIVHQLRAYSPKELKAINAVADTFRQDDSMNLKEEIINLRTGEAIVSFADESGAPSLADKALILPPHSSFVTLKDAEYRNLVESSNLYLKYKDMVDRESAYEVLLKRIEREKIQEEREKLEEERLKEIERREKELEKERKSSRKQKSYIDKGIDSMLGTITRSIGREIARGLLGSMKKRR